MDAKNRDLLLLAKKKTMNARELEQEIELIIEVLYQVENIASFCIANEVIDLNRYRIIHRPKTIMQVIRGETLKPFIFICNKN